MASDGITKSKSDQTGREGLGVETEFKGSLQFNNLVQEAQPHEQDEIH